MPRCRSGWSWVVSAAILCLSLVSPVRADTKAWRLLSNAPAFPPSLAVPLGVYDPVRNRVLAIDTQWSDAQIEVHVFEPAPEPHWSTLAVVGPKPRQPYLPGFVYDPVRDRLLVFNAWPEVETWALPLSGVATWQRIATSGLAPSRRSGQSAVYDPVHDRVVLCGGADGFFPQQFLSDVWLFSLTTNTWTAISPSGTAPGGREGHGALYDPVGARMLLFGGHVETDTRGFFNDLWELSLGDSPAWTEIHVAGPVPGARSAFGMIYDPVRRRMLIHGGVNDQSGIEPDDLWALSLDGTPEWTPVPTEDTLRGRSYPIDVYDPLGDRLLACGGGSYPQTSELSLSAPQHWNAVLPSRPLPAPGARYGHAVVRDSRRQHLVVVGGAFSSADSAMWFFGPSGDTPWRALRAPNVPDNPYYLSGHVLAAAYDSLGDRILSFSSGAAYGFPAGGSGSWTPLGALESPARDEIGLEAGIAVDSRRNRLLISGGVIPYPHSGDYTVSGVCEMSLGAAPTSNQIGRLPVPEGLAAHAAFYDPVRDRLILVGGWSRPGRLAPNHRGAVVWSTPLDSELRWSEHLSTSGPLPPGPPDAEVVFDPRQNRLFVFSDSTVWARGVDDTAPWERLEFSTRQPRVETAVAFDPLRAQAVALFAELQGSDEVQVWALDVGGLSVLLLGSHVSTNAIELQWSSGTAIGRRARIERRELGANWVDLGALDFDVHGAADFTDLDVSIDHRYEYRVAVEDGDSLWHSSATTLAMPESPRFTLRGAFPNPAVAGALRVGFSLPNAEPARLELFDVGGRLRLSTDVGALGAGPHFLELAQSRSLRAGLYVIRLERRGEARTARVVLIR